MTLQKLCLPFASRTKINRINVLSGVDAQYTDKKDIKTYGLATDPSLEKLMYENDIPKFIAGTIIGTDATLSLLYSDEQISSKLFILLLNNLENNF